LAFTLNRLDAARASRRVRAAHGASESDRARAHAARRAQSARISRLDLLSL
jgi:hypothetical protein